MKGLVYGNIIGSPFMRVGTSSRFFEAGRTHSAPWNGRVTAFHPKVTEATAQAMATARWLMAQRDAPTPEGFRRILREEYSKGYTGEWSVSSRTFLSGDTTGPVTSEGLTVLPRTVPVVLFSGSLDEALALCDICTGATHRGDGIREAARTAAMLLWEARSAGDALLERTAAGGRDPLPDGDLRSELEGLERVQLEMMGTPVEGAFTYREPSGPRIPRPEAVLMAAARCVDRSSGWEEAVRTAVSMGGPSDLLAAFTGALAGMRFGEPRLEAGMGEVIATVPLPCVRTMDGWDRMMEHRRRGRGPVLDGSTVTAARRAVNEAAFRRLSDAMDGLQEELKKMAGLGGTAGQLRLRSAIHPVTDRSSGTVTVYRGDEVMESLTLTGDGLIHTGNGDTVTASVHARSDSESLRESVLESGALFSRRMLADPAGRMDEIIDSVRNAVLGLSSRVPDPGNDGEPVKAYGDNLSSLEHDIASGGFTVVEAREHPQDSNKERHERIPTRTVYMMGLSNRSTDSLVGTLRIIGADTLVDIRSVQRSRSHPEFDPERLDDRLFAVHVDYIDGSRNLGERRPDCLDASGRSDWERMRADGDYRRSIKGIEGLMKDGRTVAVCCAEGSPTVCHRTATVARDLHEDGANVLHVMRNGEVVTHEEIENRLAEKYVARGLVDGRLPWKEQVERSFRLMNAEHGWRQEKKERSRRSGRKI